MAAKNTVIQVMYFTAILTFCSLYAAQPIQPVFQQEFHLTGFQAILFTTLMMAPLGVAPLLYGVLLEAYPARSLLRGAVFLLAILEMVFACTTSYVFLLLIRGVQGLLIPAILTSLMSYISYTSPPEKVQHNIAMYIGSTIMGGFLGRFLSGISTDLFGWRVFFFILGVGLLFSCMMLGNLKKDIKVKYVRLKMVDLVRFLGQPQFRYLYFCIFCLFFAFAALMNFLPFELRRMQVSLGQTGVGLLYLGYVSGVVICMNNSRIISFFGNEIRAVSIGVLIFVAGTLVFMAEQYQVMFLGMFVFCTGFFMAHSLLSGLVNKIAEDNKAIANGMYISFYYLGGTFGSFVPGIVFEHFGWHAFLGVLLLMLLATFAFLQLLKRSREGTA
jgi:MFS transporter, YNFM family, putative membrane transport protein